MSAREALKKFKKMVLPPTIWIAGRECIVDIKQFDDTSVDFLFSRDILGMTSSSRDQTRIRMEAAIFSSVFGEKTQTDDTLRVTDEEFPVIQKGLEYYLKKSRNELIEAVKEENDSAMRILNHRVREITILLQRILRIRSNTTGVKRGKKVRPPRLAPKRIQELIRKFSILLLSAEKLGDVEGISDENEIKVIDTISQIKNQPEEFKKKVSDADSDSLDLFDIGLDGMDSFKKAYLYIYLGNYLDRIKKKINDSSLSADAKKELLEDLDKKKDGTGRGIALQIDELFDRLLRVQGEYDAKIEKLKLSLVELLNLKPTDETLAKNIQEMIDELKMKLQKLEAQCKEIKETVSEGVGTDSILPLPMPQPDPRINALTQQFEEMNQRLKQLQEKANQDTEVAAQTRKELSDAKDELKKQNDKMEDDAKQVIELREQIQKLKVTAEESVQRSQRLEEQFQQLSKEADEAAAQQSEEAAEARRKVEEVQANLEKVKAEAAAATESVETIKGSLTSLSEENTKLKEETTRLKGRVEDLEKRESDDAKAAAASSESALTAAKEAKDSAEKAKMEAEESGNRAAAAAAAAAMATAASITAELAAKKAEDEKLQTIEAREEAVEAKQEAQEAATDAVEAKQEAQQAATDAVEAKEEAKEAATDAVEAKQEAQQAATNAVEAKQEAQEAAETSTSIEIQEKERKEAEEAERKKREEEAEALEAERKKRQEEAEAAAAEKKRLEEEAEAAAAEKKRLEEEAEALAAAAALVKQKEEEEAAVKKAAADAAEAQRLMEEAAAAASAAAAAKVEEAPKKDEDPAFIQYLKNVLFKSEYSPGVISTEKENELTDLMSEFKDDIERKTVLARLVRKYAARLHSDSMTTCVKKTILTSIKGTSAKQNTIQLNANLARYYSASPFCISESSAGDLTTSGIYVYNDFIKVIQGFINRRKQGGLPLDASHIPGFIVGNNNLVEVDKTGTKISLVGKFTHYNFTDYTKVGKNPIKSYKSFNEEQIKGWYAGKQNNSIPCMVKDEDFVNLLIYVLYFTNAYPSIESLSESHKTLVRAAASLSNQLGLQNCPYTNSIISLPTKTTGTLTTNEYMRAHYSLAPFCIHFEKGTDYYPLSILSGFIEKTIARVGETEIKKIGIPGFNNYRDGKTGMIKITTGGDDTTLEIHKKKYEDEFKVLEYMDTVEKYKWCESKRLDSKEPTTTLQRADSAAVDEIEERMKQENTASDLDASYNPQICKSPLDFRGKGFDDFTKEEIALWRNAKMNCLDELKRQLEHTHLKGNEKIDKQYTKYFYDKRTTEHTMTMSPNKFTDKERDSIAEDSSIVVKRVPITQLLQQKSDAEIKEFPKIFKKSFITLTGDPELHDLITKSSEEVYMERLNYWRAQRIECLTSYITTLKGLQVKGPNDLSKTKMNNFINYYTDQINNLDKRITNSEKPNSNERISIMKNLVCSAPDITKSVIGGGNTRKKRSVQVKRRKTHKK